MGCRNCSLGSWWACSFQAVCEPLPENISLKTNKTINSVVRSSWYCYWFGAGRPWFDSRPEQDILLSVCVWTGPASYSMSAGALSARLKRTDHEAHHLSPSSAEDKSEWSNTSTSLYVFSEQLTFIQQVKKVAAFTWP
jgi:hypothetical protein